jgi:hypothetical protein
MKNTLKHVAHKYKTFNNMSILNKNWQIISGKEAIQLVLKSLSYILQTIKNSL